MSLNIDSSLVQEIQSKLEASGYLQRVKLDLKSNILALLQNYNINDKKISIPTDNHVVVGVDEQSREQMIESVRLMLQRLNLMETLETLNKEINSSALKSDILVDANAIKVPSPVKSPYDEKFESSPKTSPLKSLKPLSPISDEKYPSSPSPLQAQQKLSPNSIDDKLSFKKDNLDEEEFGISPQIYPNTEYLPIEKITSELSESKDLPPLSTVNVRSVSNLTVSRSNRDLDTNVDELNMSIDDILNDNQDAKKLFTASPRTSPGKLHDPTTYDSDSDSEGEHVVEDSIVEDFDDIDDVVSPLRLNSKAAFTDKHPNQDEEDEEDVTNDEDNEVEEYEEEFDELDDLEMSQESEARKLREVEEKIRQLENADVDGSLTTLQQRFQEDDSEVFSVATSENLDDMDFSVGDNEEDDDNDAFSISDHDATSAKMSSKFDYSTSAWA